MDTEPTKPTGRAVQTIKGQVAFELVRQHPTASTSALARIAMRDHAAVYDDFEQARFHIRYVRGSCGDALREKMSDKTFVGTTPDPYAAIPKGREEIDEWCPEEFPGPLKVLILSDVHVPFHDEDVLKLALKYGQEHGVDTVLLNGDFVDCHSISRFLTDPREKNFKAEIDTSKEILGAVRQLFPEAEIILKEGNHEERYWAYLAGRCPELFGIDEVSLPNLLHLADYNIQWVADKRPLRFGTLNVIHGHEYKFAIQNPVNPARGFFLRTKTLCLGSHFHQSSHHSEKNLEGKVISTWSTGCACQLHPRYAPLNNWNHGFAYLEVDADQRFVLENLRVIDGKIY